MRKIKRILLPCSVCGDNPMIDDFGTYITIECCHSVNEQKHDYLTLEERSSWKINKFRYSRKVEKKAFNLVAEEWNNRTTVTV